LYVGADLLHVRLRIYQNGQVAQDGVGELKVALDLVHRGTAAAVVKANIVAAPLAADTVSEFTKAPFVGLDQISTAGGDNALEAFDRIFLSCFAQIGPQDKNGLVAPHALTSLWLSKPPKGSKERNGIVTVPQSTNKEDGAIIYANRPGSSP